MDWITRQKIDQLCKENNCTPFYGWGGYDTGPVAVTLIYHKLRDHSMMSMEELLKFKLVIYAFDLTKPWEDLETMVAEFATTCSIMDCFNDD